MSAEEILVALKAECKEGETEVEHALHAAKLEQAYKDFQHEALKLAEEAERKLVEEINPAPPGETTQIEANVVVDSAVNE